MKFANREVVELMLFDEEENLIAHLDTLKESYICIDGYESGMVVRDALLDENVLKFLGKEVEAPVVSDYQKMLNPSPKSTIITFNKKKIKKCKIIAVGYLRQSETHKDVKVTYEIPKAIIVNKLSFHTDSVQVSHLDLCFEFDSYNDDGDVMNLHIES